MDPLKKAPASTSDLRNKSRNERQKAVLLCEVMRLHCTRSSDGLMKDSYKLMKQSDHVCHESKDLIRESRVRKNS